MPYPPSRQRGQQWPRCPRPAETLAASLYRNNELFRSTLTDAANTLAAAIREDGDKIASAIRNRDSGGIQMVEEYLEEAMDWDLDSIVYLLIILLKIKGCSITDPKMLYFRICFLILSLIYIRYSVVKAGAMSIQLTHRVHRSSKWSLEGIKAKREPQR